MPSLSPKTDVSRALSLVPLELTSASSILQPSCPSFEELGAEIRAQALKKSCLESSMLTHISDEQDETDANQSTSLHSLGVPLFNVMSHQACDDVGRLSLRQGNNALLCSTESFLNIKLEKLSSLICKHQLYYPIASIDGDYFVFERDDLNEICKSLKEQWLLFDKHCLAALNDANMSSHGCLRQLRATSVFKPLEPLKLNDLIVQSAIWPSALYLLEGACAHQKPSVLLQGIDVIGDGTGTWCDYQNCTLAKGEALRLALFDMGSETKILHLKQGLFDRGSCSYQGCGLIKPDISSSFPVFTKSKAYEQSSLMGLVRVLTSSADSIISVPVSVELKPREDDIELLLSRATNRAALERELIALKRMSPYKLFTPDNKSIIAMSKYCVEQFKERFEHHALEDKFKLQPIDEAQDRDEVAAKVIELTPCLSQLSLSVPNYAQSYQITGVNPAYQTMIERSLVFTLSGLLDCDVPYEKERSQVESMRIDYDLKSLCYERRYIDDGQAMRCVKLISL